MTRKNLSAIYLDEDEVRAHSKSGVIRRKTGKLIAFGCQVRYSPKGEQLDDVTRAHQTVYAVFDPNTERWSPWQVLELPANE